MATSTLVSLEQYLNTSYEPDMEYIDGELKPKEREQSMVQWTHSNLQYQIGLWFGQHRKEWKLTCGVETRIKIPSSKIRLPDVVVDFIGRRPEVLTDPPLITIEILSPSDTFSETLEKIEDYLALGVQNVWIIDPVQRTGYVCTSTAPPRHVTRFDVADSPIHLDLPQLFASFDDDNGV